MTIETNDYDAVDPGELANNILRAGVLSRLGWAALDAIEDLLFAYDPDGVIDSTTMDDFVVDVESVMIDATYAIEALVESVETSVDTDE